jgi:hypothetical protein
LTTVKKCEELSPYSGLFSMYNSLFILFKDMDSKIISYQASEFLCSEWKKEFGMPVPHFLAYRLSYLGTIFTMYQQDKIERQHLRDLINIMYYEKYIRDDVVEEIFLSRVDLEQKKYIKRMLQA